MESLHSNSNPISPLEQSDDEESDELEDDEDMYVTSIFSSAIIVPLSISSAAISDTNTEVSRVSAFNVCTCVRLYYI